MSGLCVCNLYGAVNGVAEEKGGGRKIKKIAFLVASGVPNVDFGDPKESRKARWQELCEVTAANLSKLGPKK